MDARAHAAASVVAARAELERALVQIDLIETIDPTLIGLVAHALGNCITVTAATVEMLQLTLADHPNADVSVWLEGIGRTTNLMQHSVSRLVSVSAPSDFPLTLDQVNLVVFMERACDYYRGHGSPGVHVTCAAVGRVPLVFADRVALAVVAENLLSNAVRASKPHGTVHVRVLAEPGRVVCSLKDTGPGLTAERWEGIVRRSVQPGGGPAAAEPTSDFGLAIANDFVRRMDGDLWCESEPDHGARISFALPAVE